ncbi:hypothetical protein NDU88_004507 [Pleurodeles waltl]|uniref:Secreted protein n=1 Tax=Pleurodeles waltl TaxID=8319 RepID=A0AAV7T8B0_PLEWA|nr:hypothetical protein NDU88_004507 [Pleurodeles waltl]
MLTKSLIVLCGWLTFLLRLSPSSSLLGLPGGTCGVRVKRHSVARVSAGCLPRRWFVDPRCREGFLPGLRSDLQHHVPGLLLSPPRVSSVPDATRPSGFLSNRLSYPAGAWHESSYSVPHDPDVDGDCWKDAALPGRKWQQKPGHRTPAGPLVVVAARHSGLSG